MTSYCEQIFVNKSITSNWGMGLYCVCFFNPIFQEEKMYPFFPSSDPHPDTYLSKSLTYHLEIYMV